VEDTLINADFCCSKLQIYLKNIAQVQFDGDVIVKVNFSR